MSSNLKSNLPEIVVFGSFVNPRAVRFNSLHSVERLISFFVLNLAKVSKFAMKFLSSIAAFNLIELSRNLKEFIVMSL
jgi:hypothetical protein